MNRCLLGWFRTKKCENAMDVKHQQDTAEEKRVVYKAFSRAIGQEAYVLRREPDLLWQQLYNRLQWENKGGDSPVQMVITPEFKNRISSAAKPWFHNKCKTMESETFLRLIKEHSGRVNSSAFSPDGSSMVSASEDKTIRLWNTNNRDEKLVLKGHTAAVTFCAFSSDGHTLASVGADHTVRLWDVQSGKQQTVLIQNIGTIHSCAFSPDGRTLASTGCDVRIWDLYSGKELSVFKGQRDWDVKSCNFSPDGCSLGLGTYQAAGLWDLPSGNVRPIFTGHFGYVTSCVFSPDGSILASACEDGTVGMCNINRGNEQKILKGHGGSIHSITFSPDGHFLSSAGADGTVRLWDVKEGKERAVFTGHTAGVYSCAFSPDGRTLVSASEDKTVRWWDVRSGEEQAVLNSGKGRISNFLFSPDGCSLALRGMDGNVSIIESQSGIESTNLNCRIKDVQSWAFDRVGQILTLVEGNNLWLWDPCSGEKQTFPILHSWCRVSEFAPDGCTLAFEGEDHTIILWNALKKEIQTVCKGHTNVVFSLRFSPTGQTIASQADESVRWWNVHNGEELTVLKGQAMLWLNHYLAFSPDGCTMVSAMDDNTIRVVDGSKGYKQLVLAGHTEPASFCVFSPDGRTLISVGGDDTVRIWDIRTGEEQAVIKNRNSPRGVCAFSPDGSTLVTSGEDNTVRLWDSSSGLEMAGFTGRIEPGNSIFSPNGCTLCLQSDDQTLQLWDVKAGKIRQKFSSIGKIKHYVFSPLGDLVAMIDEAGNFYLLELMASTKVPIIITATEENHELIVLCPACQNQHRITNDQPGCEFTCPTEGCGVKLKINPFVLHMA
jgi:WD40 repeat protein